MTRSLEEQIQYWKSQYEERAAVAESRGRVANSLTEQVKDLQQELDGQKLRAEAYKAVATQACQELETYKNPRS